MGIEDLFKAGKVLGKVDEAADAARAARLADDVKHAELVLNFEGTAYRFHNMTFREAQDVMMNKVVRPTVKGDVEEVVLPSTLPAAGVPIVAGNIEVEKQPQVKNSDGSISTVRSFSVNFDGEEVLLTTVHPDGHIMSEYEAKEYYKKTGKHLGKFKTPEDATAYAEKLHEDEAKRIQKEPKKLDPGIYVDEDTGKYFKITKDGTMEPIDEAP